MTEQAKGSNAVRNACVCVRVTDGKVPEPLTDEQWQVVLAESRRLGRMLNEQETEEVIRRAR